MYVYLFTLNSMPVYKETSVPLITEILYMLPTRMSDSSKLIRPVAVIYKESTVHSQVGSDAVTRCYNDGDTDIMTHWNLH